MIKNISLFIFSVVLSGCSLSPDYVKPDTVADGNKPLKAAQGSHRYSFREMFAQDEHLAEVLKQAQINNYDLQDGLMRVEMSRAQMYSSIFDLIPGVSFTGTKSTSMSEMTSPFTGKDVKQKTKTYQSSLGFDSYEVDIWGKKLSEIDSLSEESKGDQSLVAALQLTLMSDLANTWYETLSMIKIWHMLTGKIVMLDDIHTRLKGVNEMERLDPLLLSKFMRGKTSDVTNQQNLQKEILNRIHKLEYLSGYRSPWLNEESWKNLSGDYAIQTVPQSIQSDVIFNRPDVIAAEAKIKAANGTIGMARAAFLPVFNLFANAYHTSDSFDRVLGNLTDNWTLTPSVIIPIFRWPKNYANLNYAHSQQALAVVAYRKSVAQGLLDIQDSTNNLRASEETTATLMDEVDIHRQNLSKLTTRYEAGYGDLYNLYEAIDLLTSSQFDLESHRQQVMTNTIVLLKAIGG